MLWLTRMPRPALSAGAATAHAWTRDGAAHAMADEPVHDRRPEAPAEKGPGMMTLVKALAFVSVIVIVQVCAAAMLLPSAEETREVGRKLAGAGHGEEDHADDEGHGDDAEHGDGDGHGEHTREVTLGTYHIVSFNPKTGASLSVDFELFGTVLAEEQAEFDHLYARPREANQRADHDRRPRPAGGRPDRPRFGLDQTDHIGENQPRSRQAAGPRGDGQPVLVHRAVERGARSVTRVCRSVELHPRTSTRLSRNAILRRTSGTESYGDDQHRPGRNRGPAALPPQGRTTPTRCSSTPAATRPLRRRKSAAPPGGVSQDDIELLLRKAEQALASIDEPADGLPAERPVVQVRRLRRRRGQLPRRPRSS